MEKLLNKPYFDLTPQQSVTLRSMARFVTKVTIRRNSAGECVQMLSSTSSLNYFYRSSLSLWIRYLIDILGTFCSLGINTSPAVMCLL